MVHVLSLHLYSLSLFLAVFVQITCTGRTSLYCSSEYLIIFEMGNAQLVDSTAFCTLTRLNYEGTNTVLLLNSEITLRSLLNSDLRVLIWGYL